MKMFLNNKQKSSKYFIGFIAIEETHYFMKFIFIENNKSHFNVTTIFFLKNGILYNYYEM